MKKEKNLKGEAKFIGGCGSEVLFDSKEFGEKVNGTIERMGPYPNVTIGYEVGSKGYSEEVSPANITFK